MIRLAYVNAELIAQDLAWKRELDEHAKWILAGNRCIACESPGAEYVNVDGWPLCAACGIDAPPDDDGGTRQGNQLGRAPRALEVMGILGDSAAVGDGKP